MTPAAAVSDRVEQVMDVLSPLREQLNERERLRFEVEMFDALRGSDEELRSTLLGWALMVSARNHPAYAEDFREFMEFALAGETAAASG